MGIGRGSQKIGGCWKPFGIGPTGMADPKKHDSPPALPCQIWSLRSNDMSVIKEIRQKNFDISHPTFQDHSRLLEPKRINRLPMFPISDQ